MAWGGTRDKLFSRENRHADMGMRGGWSHCFVYQLLLSVMSSDK
jgi:hypothetical protein